MNRRVPLEKRTSRSKTSNRAKHKQVSLLVEQLISQLTLNREQGRTCRKIINASELISNQLTNEIKIEDSPGSELGRFDPIMPRTDASAILRPTSIQESQVPVELGTAEFPIHTQSMDDLHTSVV